MAAARDLPQRSTRGKRMQAMIDEEEEVADNEFWNQEFFAEEGADEEYAAESESEDVPDTDFDESESEDDEDSDDEPQEKRRKALKPPGAPPARPKPALKKPAPPREPGDGGGDADGGDASPGGTAARRPVKRVRLPSPPAAEVAYHAPSLRRSTKLRSEEAEFNRSLREQLKPRRRVAAADTRVLTQGELLEEAARTEVENLASLKLLLAREEETKRRANMARRRYAGPAIKWRSFTLALSAGGGGHQQQPAGPPEASPAPGAAAPAEQGSQQQASPGADAAPAAGAGAAAAASGLPQPDQPAGSAAVGAGAGSDGAAAAAAGSEPSPTRQHQQAGGPGADAGGAAAAAPGSVPGEGAAAAPPPAEEGAPAGTSPAAPTQRLEQAYMQPINCKVLPRWLKPRQAQPAPLQPLCSISGAPARYCDPLTRQYFSSIDAFKELRRRAGRPLQAPAGAGCAAQQAGGGCGGPSKTQPAAMGFGGVLFASPADASALEGHQGLQSEEVMALVLQFSQQQAAGLQLG
jgi:hypothetical protein